MTGLFSLCLYPRDWFCLKDLVITAQSWPLWGLSWILEVLREVSPLWLDWSSHAYKFSMTSARLGHSSCSLLDFLWSLPLCTCSGNPQINVSTSPPCRSHLSLLKLGKCFKAQNQTKHEVYFVWFSFPKDHSTMLLDIQCLKTIVLFIYVF